MNESTRPQPVSPQWLYKPVPANEPDVHEEFACEAIVSPEGHPILAARVRGKKHKHEGTNCDDWYEVKNSGCWTIIAVADGAGSKKFSRVGARVSCQEAVRVLASAGLPNAPRPATIPPSPEPKNFRLFTRCSAEPHA